MTEPPGTLSELQVALSLDAPDGPQVAAWRDHYLANLPSPGALVDSCVEDLHERRLCYSCGKPADHLVADEFPWACSACDPGQ